MVHYIRFLKPPKLIPIRKDVTKIKALLTVTTDLGETFFDRDLEMRVMLVSNTQSNKYPRVVSLYGLHWRKGMRVLWLEQIIKISEYRWPSRLVVSPQDTNVGEEPSKLSALPAVVNIYSEFFEPSSDHERPQRVERQLNTTTKQDLCIWEDTGDSIARHIWFVDPCIRDSGIAFLTLLHDGLKLPKRKYQDSLFAQTLQALRQSPTNVLELGSGCGTVGIGFAQLFPKANILLTDLPDAMEILDLNMTQANRSSNLKIEKATLDWETDLPAPIRKTKYDIILICDCTYNIDSIPVLVRTLSNLVAVSPDVSIIVSTKVRHSSEAIFFDLMSDASFKILDHVSVPLPDGQRKTFDDTPLENVDIYLFRGLNPQSVA